MGDFSVLLVSDKPGHIIERIGLSWVRHVKNVNFELINSDGKSVFELLRRGEKLGIIHWIDRWGFQGLAAGTTVPQVAMIHHLTEHEVQPGIKKLKYADAITAVSKRWQSRLESLADREVILFPYTVDTKIFRPVGDRSLKRRMLGIKDEEYVLGFVGKAYADKDGRKGIDLLLSVVNEAARQWKNLCLLLIGPGWDSLAKKIESSGVKVVQQQFVFSEETAQVYPLMDVLLVTSVEEGGPCTILEAMSCGVPCITSDVGHVPEVIKDGETGFICPKRELSEYIEKLTALRTITGLKEKIGNKAQMFIKRERDERIVIPNIDFVSLYANAIKNFQQRSWFDLAARRIPQAYWKLRKY